MLTSTRPKNSPRACSGWSETKDSITPATVSTAAPMPTSTGSTSHQSVRASSVRSAAVRPEIPWRAAPITWEAESMSSS